MNYNPDVGMTLEEVYLKYYNLLYQFAHDFEKRHQIKIKGFTLEDLLSAAKIGMTQGYTGYKKGVIRNGKEVQFSTYMGAMAKGQIKNIYYQDDGLNPHIPKKKKKDFKFSVLSMDKEIEMLDTSSNFHELVGIEDDQTLFFIHELMTLFNEREKSIVSMLQLNYTKDEIATEFSISRERVYQILRNIQEKTKNYIEGNPPIIKKCGKRKKQLN